MRQTSFRERDAHRQSLVARVQRRHLHGFDRRSSRRFHVSRVERLIPDPGGQGRCRARGESPLESGCRFRGAAFAHGFHAFDGAQRAAEKCRMVAECTFAGQWWCGRLGIGRRPFEAAQELAFGSSPEPAKRTLDSGFGFGGSELQQREAGREELG